MHFREKIAGNEHLVVVFKEVDVDTRVICESRGKQTNGSVLMKKMFCK